MIVTILARLDGVDTSGSNPWCAAGRTWAMNAGVWQLFKDFFFYNLPNTVLWSFRRITAKAITQITTDSSEPAAVAKPMGKSVAGKSCEVR